MKYYRRRLWHEETLIDRILNQGLEKKDLPKYYVLRIAIAKALSLPKSPLNAPLWENKKLGGDRGKEYHLEQITGKGKDEKEDFDVALREDYMKYTIATKIAIASINGV